MRAAKVVPDFIKAAVLHLVEINEPLQTIQERTLGTLGMPVFWHSSLGDVPAGPSIVVANEFFDALPINQAVKMADGWHRRAIAIDSEGTFMYQAEPQPIPHFAATLPAALRNAPEGEIFEWRSDTETMELGRRIVRDPSVALVIDYGHVESTTGETLQAVREHLFADPLSNPGEADITAHVDFEALGRTLESMGAKTFGPITQAAFLDRLGIDTRAQTLKANLSRAKAHEIDAAMARLTGAGRTGMGTLFKAIAVAHPKIGTPPAFET
jgi:SAM-dependent MidA family methyltransferase